MTKTKTVVTVISKISERAAPHTSALVVIYGEDLGRKYELERQETIIGRSSGCDIQVDQDSVSRNHARVALEDDVALVADMGSTNGTLVNDEVVAVPTKLRNGDLIKIGRTIFKYIAGGNIEVLYHEEIYRLTTTDGLTQVYNKRYFLETLEREISRCNRYSRSLCLAMIDIDHFKQVNDTYGHLAGDYVLKHLASAAKGRVRREDVFARYGGEEFSIILPEIDLEGALITGEKLRKLIEEQRFCFEDQVIPVTISIGIAQMNEGVKEATSLIGAADAKLYQAKAAGRNRTVG